MTSAIKFAAGRAAGLLFLTGLTTLGTPVNGSAQEDGTPGGEIVYMQVCMGCHGGSGDGNPGVYPPLAGSEWVNGPVARLVNILLHGISGPMMVAGEEYTGLMPGWGPALKDEEIAAVATYVRTSWGNFGSGVSVEEVSKIREANRSRTTPWTAAELIAATRPEP